MARARIGVVGAGMIGKRHLTAIAASEQAELVAICDLFPAAQDLAHAFSVPWFSDTVAMMEDAGPDGVIVATPTEHHLQPVVQALESGAHVLVEKPITATIAEADRVIETSTKTGRHVLVGHHRRYYDCVYRAREIVRDGALGQLVAVCGQWNVRKHNDYYAADWRLKREAGPVLTNLIHDMDTLRYICGEIESVSAETSTGAMGAEKEDAAALIVRFVDGGVGTFVMSDRTNAPWAWEFATGENPAFPKSGLNTVRLMGTKASLEFPNLVLWTNSADQDNWNHLMEPTEIPLTLGDAFVDQIDHFSAVIVAGADPRITAPDATRTLQATLAVFEAAETGRRVTL